MNTTGSITTSTWPSWDGRASQLEQRMAELLDELAAVQRESVSTAQIQRAVALFEPVWELRLIPERFRILHLLLEAVIYDGSTGELELGSTRSALRVWRPRLPWSDSRAW